jgi:hypothetical protein
MKTVQAKVVFTEKATRIEMLYRIVWGIVGLIVLWIFAMIASLMSIIHFFYILIYKKRHRTIFEFVRAVYIQYFRLASYLIFLTDERPPLVPQMDV